MKTLMIGCTVFLIACSYQPYITVKSRNDVPRGSSELLLSSSLESFKLALKNNSILYNELDGGIITEEVLLDPGTRAQMKAYVMGNEIKVVPYWGITQQVRATVAAFGGISSMGNDLQRVSYSSSAGRPKMVYDWAVQVCASAGRVTFR